MCVHTDKECSTLSTVPVQWLGLPPLAVSVEVMAQTVYSQQGPGVRRHYAVVAAASARLAVA